MKMIICVTGMPGAGKSTAARILKAKGFGTIEMGSFVRQLMKEKGMRVNRDSLRSFSTELRKQHGPAAVAKLAAKAAKAAKGDTAIIGIRSPAEVYSLRAALGAAAVVIAITTPIKERHDRLGARSRTDDPVTEKGLMQRDRIEMGWGITDAIAMADVIISNEGTKKELEESITEVIGSMRRAKVHKRRSAA